MSAIDHTDNAREGREMRTDFENLADGARVILHPNSSNPLHNTPITATYQAGYFYCDGSDPRDGPDYYWRDVLQYNDGFVEEQEVEA